MKRDLNSQSRVELIRVLIRIWFPNQENFVIDSFGYDEFEAIQRSLFDSGGATYNAHDLKDEDRIFVRNAAFRRSIIRLYDQRCAFCEMRVVSWDGQNIVGGAHIMPFSEFHNDLFVNGIALCKNHHWAFDRGWFGIDDEYRIMIPRDRFTEEPALESREMMSFSGEVIGLPRERKFLPSLEDLRWHQEKWMIC